MRLTTKTERWFDIPGDPDGAKIKILHLKPGEVQKIEAETSQWNGKFVGDQFSSELQYSPQRQLRQLRMAALVDWKGFFDEHDQTLPCTPKNKNLYFDEDPILSEDEKRFSELIDEFRIALADSLKPQEAQAEGN
jgi:hypothetical protein